MYRPLTAPASTTVNELRPVKTHHDGAAAPVFNTAELLEAILLYLEPDDLMFKVPLVCHGFRHQIVEASPELKRITYRMADKADFAADAESRVPSHLRIPGLDFTIAPREGALIIWPCKIKTRIRNSVGLRTLQLCRPAVQALSVINAYNDVPGPNDFRPLTSVRPRD